MSVTIDLFRNETDHARFERGAVIFNEGEPGDAMYAVLEGSVELRVRGKLVETLGPGGVFGEMALVERASRSATATAAADCRLAAIPEKRFLNMVQQTPYFAVQLLQVVVERLRRMDEKL